MSGLIDIDLFWKRLSALYGLWKSTELPSDGLPSCEYLMVASGKRGDDSTFGKVAGIQLWLTGYELADTVILMNRDTRKVVILTGKKKAKMLKTIGVNRSGLSLDLRILPKVESDMIKAIATLVEELKEDAQVGIVVKEVPIGPILSKLPADIETKLSSGKIVDVSPSLSRIMQNNRSPEELKSLERASKLSDIFLAQVILPEIETVLDTGKKVSPAEVASRVDALSQEQIEALVKKHIKDDPNIDADEMESCFTPIIQSLGSGYDLRPSASSKPSPAVVTGDAVIISVGQRYAAYCSTVARTFLINPDRQLEHAYQTLCQVRSSVHGALKAGQTCADVYKAATASIQSSSTPDLISKFPKSIGFATGLEYRDPYMMLSAKNSDSTIREGMSFITRLGFTSIRSSGKSVSLLIADTVIVGKTAGKSLTTADVSLKSISYFLDNGDDQVDDGVENVGIDYDVLFTENGDRRPRTRGLANVADSTTLEKEEKRKRAQQELADRKQAQMIKKFTSNAIDKEFDANRPINSQIESYSTVKDFPKDAMKHEIHVDIQHESILVPINGRLVPIHISVVKNVTKYEQGEYTYFRVNLAAPGTTQANAGLHPYADQKLAFIKEITFRAFDSRNINKSVRLVKELQKRVAQRQRDYQDRESLVVQRPLVLNKNPKLDFRLRELQIRPALGGKKLTGVLGTHTNGLLFTSNKGQRLEVLYSNIKHAFYQPADSTISVLLHFELRSPIMCGNKRTNYIQVFVDVVDASQDLVGSSRKGFYDRDGIQEEQQERLKRNRCNEKFRTFARNVEDAVRETDPDNAFEFDIPYKEIQFPGVPFKSSCMVIPTVHCLVALDDQPPFVLSLDEVEIAHFERVQFSLRNFDLVFVLKDLEQPVIKIRSIPREHLEPIQQYLTESDIVYFVGQMNLLWPKILKVIKNDEKYFFTEQGGWASVLGSHSDEEDDDDAEQESEYEVDEESDDDEEDSDEYESDDASDGDEEDEEEDEEDEGPSWEQLEQDTIREEREKAARRGEDDDDDERRPSKPSKRPRK